jgi:hypothetical protein
MESVMILVIAMPLAMVLGLVTVGGMSAALRERAELRYIERMERELSPFIHMDDVMVAEKIEHTTTIKRDVA